MSNPASLLFTASHEWIEAAGDVRRIGITDHAQHLLGDIVYTDLPKVGKQVKRGDAIIVVESPKAAADVYAPVTGEIVEVNSALEAEPSKINQDPYGDGWIIAIRVTGGGDATDLLSEGDYKKSIGE